MTTITFRQDITISKTDFNNVLEFIEEIEDQAFGEIISKNALEKSFDISLLEKKYLGK